MGFSEACDVVGTHAVQPASAWAYAAVDQGANAWQGDMQKQGHDRLDDSLQGSMETPPCVCSMLLACSAGSSSCIWACKAQCS